MFSNIADAETGLPVAKEGLSDHMIQQAEAFVQKFPTCFIGGSFVVKGKAANDIDICVPWSLWVSDIRDKIMDSSCDILGDPRYAVEQVLYALREARQWHDIQFLAIRDEYMPAYRDAVEEMKASPEAFQERDARVAVHKKHRDIVTEKLQEF